MNTPLPSQVSEQARQLFNQGFCCSESALLAVAKGFGIDTPCIPAVASGFCGGMARTGGACGALTGAIMGVGVVLGRASLDASSQPAQSATRRLVSAFRAQFQEVNCHALLGFDPHGSQETIDAIFAKEGRRDRCADFTGVAAALAAGVIQETGA